MKLLHTADWHLCDRLGRINRTADLRQRVEQVANYCEEHQVDLLLIAGDLFYEKASEDEIAESLKHILSTFQAFFDRGGTILAITGNHDDDQKIELVRTGMRLASTVNTRGEFQRGRLYLQNGLTLAKYTSHSGERMQFVLVPYPKAARYGLPETYRTREEEFRELQNALAGWLTRERHSPQFDITLPTVLMAHVHVRGANLNTNLFRFSQPTDIQFEQADLLSGWAYVALGHIHLPQSIGGSEIIRYPGPLDRLDFGERDDERGVLLVNIENGDTTVTRLPLDPTPLHRVKLDDPDEQLPTLSDRYPDRERAILQIEVQHTSQTKLSRDEIARKLKALFPRLHQLSWATAPGEISTKASVVQDVHAGESFEQVVRNYLQQRLKSDPEQKAVLELAEHFLSEAKSGGAA